MNRTLILAALAVAVEKGPAEAHAAAMEIDDKVDGEWEGKPEAMFGRLFCSDSANLAKLFAVWPCRKQATVAVLDAIASGETGDVAVLDPFGKPYKVTWFDDCVYFESASQWAEPHDLDFGLAKNIDFEEYRERLQRLSETKEAVEKAE